VALDLVTSGESGRRGIDEPFATNFPGQFSENQADFRRKSSSFSLQPQLEQLRQQKIKTPTPTVMSTASRVPNESKVCGERCMGQYLIGQNVTR
jgi:hypothetical protein